MKKFFTLWLSLAAVATVVANTINWSLTNFDVHNVDGSTGKLSDYQVYLLPSTFSVGDDGVATTDGTPIQSTVLNFNTTVEGAVEVDDAISSANYLMTIFAGGKYYALTDGTGDVVIPYSITSDNFDALTGSYEAGNDLMGQYGAPEGKSYSTRAAAVPEPATAVLALAGIAMMIRRRRS